MTTTSSWLRWLILLLTHHHHHAALVGIRTPNATRYLLLSNAAYCFPPALDAWQCLPCRLSGAVLESVWRNTSLHMQAVSARWPDEPDTLVVAFQGSRDPVNFCYDFAYDARVVDDYVCKGCRVHRGFASLWESLAPTMLGALERVPRSHRLVFTGHSLGGALAVLAAAHVHWVTGRTPQVFTFGAPRVGNPPFADAWRRAGLEGWRIVHGRDPVPHLPPRSLGFLHTPHERFYSSDDQAVVQECDDRSADNTEDPACSAGVLAPFVLHDHQRYLGRDIRPSLCRAD